MKYSSLCLIACLTGAGAVHAAPAKPAVPAAPAALANTASTTTAAAAAPATPAKAGALTADAINNAGTAPVAKGKPSAAVILRAQILLDRARFSPGEIDGGWGSNMRLALTGYQKQRGLQPSGLLDAATLQALNADTAAPLVEYTIVDADLTGPFTKIPAEMADKAKLPGLGYESIEEALGERFHMSPTLLKRLNPGKSMTAGETIMVANVLGTEPLPKAGKIVVDRTERTLTLFDTTGKTMAQFPSSTGSEHDPLPVGTWKVNGVSKNPTFHYNPKLFWDAKEGDAKAKIPPGPNNPVGVAWVDLSKDHYGIHGTPVPASIGKTQSHGCIRLTNWDVAALTDAVAPGTEVVLQD